MSAKQDFQINRWQYLINEFQKSGKKLKDWCADNGISKDQYYYWISRVRLKYYDTAVKQLQTSEAIGNNIVGVQNGAFVEINPEMVNEAFMQRSLPAAVLQKDSIRIEIMPGASSSFIKQLLTAVHDA